MKNKDKSKKRSGQKPKGRTDEQWQELVDELYRINEEQQKIIEEQNEIIKEEKKKSKAFKEQADRLGEALKKAHDQIEALTRQSKRQAAPFRISDKKRKQQPQKPGRKKGHKGHHRQVPDKVDREVEVALDQCPHCQGAISDVRQIEQYIEEIPRPRKEVTRLVTYKGQCEHCGEVHSDHPLKTSDATGAAKCQLGPRAQAMAVEMMYDYSFTYSTTARLMKEVYGLHITRGGLVQLCQKIGRRCSYHYEQLVEQAAQADVLHADETSWYVGSPQHYLWFFGNKDLAVYRIADNRSRENVKQIIGEQYSGVLVSDCYSVYDDVNPIQQKCYAHHLKEISRILERCEGAENAYIQKLRLLLRTALLLKRIKHDIRAEQYDEAICNLEKKASELLDEQRANPEEERIANRLRKQKDHLFTFLKYEQVDATNNLAERMLRPAVISRKISCGNKTDQGARTWEVLSSILNTNRLRGKDNHHYLVQVVRGNINPNEPR